MAKRKTKKTKPYTLAGYWENIKSIAPKCLDAADSDKEANFSQLLTIIDEVNSSSIPHSIGNLFVEPHIEAKKYRVLFSAPGSPDSIEIGNPVSYSSGEVEDQPAGEAVIEIDSISLYKYVESFTIPEKDGDDDENEEKSAAFKKKRQIAFMKEMAKLPDPYFVYLAVLQELAYCNDVVSVEDRDGNFHESDAGFYLSLLWAFKEFEVFYLRAQNRSLRADYGIIWHEGEWIEETRRTRGYV